MDTSQPIMLTAWNSTKLHKHEVDKIVQFFLVVVYHSITRKKNIFLKPESFRLDVISNYIPTTNFLILNKKIKEVELLTKLVSS
jgi:hypothetical protein